LIGRHRRRYRCQIEVERRMTRLIERNTAALTACCVCLGFVFGLLIGGTIAPPVQTEPWLKTYQGLVGALVGVIGAGAGLAVATYNVLRQMRINLMSREEERMEDTLPGLIETNGFLTRLTLAARLGASTVVHHLRNEGCGNAKAIREAIASKLPRTNATSSRPVDRAPSLYHLERR
jgi:hypothetical protein